MITKMKINKTSVLFLPALIGGGGYSYAIDKFNTTALEIGNPDRTPVDLTQFSQPGGNLPGVYRVDVFINEVKVDTTDISFSKTKEGLLSPEITLGQYHSYGVNTEKISNLSNFQDTDILPSISDVIPEASATFNFSRQRLVISIPQAYIKNEPRHNVNPESWDDGIPAMLLSYSLSGTNRRGIYDNEFDSDNYFASLRSGLNAGAWRLRNYSTWNYSSSHDNNSEQNWDSINTWIQRDLKSIRGKFILGESYTPSDVFDSVRFKGVQISSEDNMLPDSLRGFAPTVRGIANSNAQVTIRQNEIIIYQTSVPPGPFTIEDLYPTSASGELYVTIRESDGSEHSFTQPFSNVPVMLREGQMKYSFTTGQYHDASQKNTRLGFGQATIIYGLPSDITLYGGVQYSNFYQSLNTGIGISLGDFGSLSSDITQSSVKFANAERSHEEGQSLRFLYSKTIDETDSIVTLAGYRYSTQDYYSFNEAIEHQNIISNNEKNVDYNKKSKMQINFQQNLFGGHWGALSLSGYQQDYWNQSGKEKNISVSYANTFDYFSVIFTYSNTRTLYYNANNNQQLSINFSVPLSQWMPNAYATANIVHDFDKQTLAQTGVNGSLLDKKNLRYSVMAGYGNHGQDNSGLASIDYLGTYGEASTGYSFTGTNRQLNYGLQGALVAHSHGITLGQPIFGDMTSIALVQAEGARDVAIQNKIGVRTDWRGYTLVPYLNPYKRSSIVLNPESLDNDIELTDYAKSVVPTAGAIVLASYNTNIGRRVLMTLHHNQMNVPFGATVVIDKNSKNMSIVGDDGEVYLSGMPEKGSVIATWNNGEQSCQADFNLQEETDTYKGILSISEECK